MLTCDGGPKQRAPIAFPPQGSSTARLLRASCTALLSLYDDAGDVGKIGDPVINATEQHARNITGTAAPQNDRIHGLAFGDRQDRICGLAFRGLCRGGGQSVGTNPSFSLLGDLVAEGLAIVVSSPFLFDRHMLGSGKRSSSGRS